MTENELETAVAPRLRPEPDFIQLPKFRLAGLETTGSNQKGELAALWDTFLPRMKELVPSSETSVTFGVCEMRPGLPEGHFAYLCAVRVDENTPLPVGMCAWEIPAQTYAVLPAYNIPDLVPLTHYFYEQWLPASERWQAAPSAMFELYPAAYPIDPTILVYFPIQSR